MALPSTLHRFAIDLSDVDRGVYAALEFQLARHPSETVAFALVRVLAYALEYQEDLSFGRGIGNPDEPALSAAAEFGGVALWIDVGAPSADRLHKASKHADSVVVYTHKELSALQQAWSGVDIHNADQIRVVSVDGALIDALTPMLDRRNAWQILRTDGTVYVTVGDQSVSGTLKETRVG